MAAYITHEFSSPINLGLTNLIEPGLYEKIKFSIDNFAPLKIKTAISNNNVIVNAVLWVTSGRSSEYPLGLSASALINMSGLELNLTITASKDSDDVNIILSNKV